MDFRRCPHQRFCDCGGVITPPGSKDGLDDIITSMARVSPSCWFLLSKGMYVRMVSMSWDAFLVVAMEVLSVDRDPDHWRISSWNASGFSAQTRASLLCSNVVDCIELLLPPWFAEGVVRQCRVVRGTTTSGKSSGAPAYFLRVRLSMTSKLAVDLSLTNCCRHQTSPTPRKCCSCQLSLFKKPSGIHDFFPERHGVRRSPPQECARRYCIVTRREQFPRYL